MRILFGGDIFVLLFNVLEVMTQKSANDNRDRLAHDYANNCFQIKVNRLRGNGFCKTPSEPLTYRGNCYNHFNRYPSLNNIHSNYRIDPMGKYHQLENFQHPEEFLFCYFRSLIKNIPNNGNAPIVADRTYDLLTSRIRALQQMPPHLKSYQVPSKRAHPLTKYFELVNAAGWRARVFEKEKCASPNNGITLSNFGKWLPHTQIAQHRPESTFAATPLHWNKTMPWNKCPIPRSKLHAVEKHHFKTSKMSYQLIFNFLCGDYNTFFDLCRRFLTPPSRSISTNYSELQQCVYRCKKFFINDPLPRSKVHDFKHDHSDLGDELRSQLNHNSNVLERTPIELKQNKSEISVASEESNTTMADVNAKIDFEISTEAVLSKDNTFKTLLHSAKIYSRENGSLTSF